MAQPSVNTTQRACPNFDTLFDFNVGNVTEDELEAISAHLSTCQICQETIESICHHFGELGI